MKRTLVFIAGLSCLLPVSDAAPKTIRVTKTEHADLPVGGTVRFRNSTGELSIEGWDQDGVEITTTKSTRLSASVLDQVKVSVAREGNELVITTQFPRHTRFLPRPSVGARDFDLAYVVKVPRDAKLIVDHDAGEVLFAGVTGDIRAATNQGLISLWLASTGQYTIDAKCRIGEVTSDFPGIRKREHFGHTFIQTARSSHSLYLRNGFGDVLILKDAIKEGGTQAPPL